MLIHTYFQTTEKYVDWTKVYNVAPNAVRSISQSNLIADADTYGS